MESVFTTCPYCGCGCGLYLQVRDGQLVGVIPSRHHPISSSKLCLRGWHSHESTTRPDRLRTPLIRRDGTLQAATWDEALDAAAAGLKAARDQSPDAVGVLGSALATNEESYLLARLAGQAIGTRHFDCLRRQGVAAAMLDATSPAEITALDHAYVVFVCGGGLAEEAPLAAWRVLEAARRGAAVIVLSSRRDQMADVATLHLQPRPGTETACLQALVRLAEDAGRFDPAQIASLVQVDADALRQAAETCARADRAVIVCGQGSGPEADAPALATALRDLAAATGSGLLPMTSYGNLRGALDMGVRSTDGAAAMLGQVKALYVMGDDPLAVASSPATARQVLERLDFLVVQDVFLSETAKLAHVVLPGAIFAEKDGTMTSAEGRVQRLRPAVAPVGEARPDWWILSQLAARLGLPTAYDSPAAIRAEIAQTVPGYAEIAGDAWEDGWGLLLGPLSAPVATPSAGDEASPATANEEFPVLLWVDPHLYPWDGDAMAAHSPTLAREYLIRARDYRRGYVQMRPDEMRAQSVRPGAPVKIISAHGETTLPVMPENGIPAGTICLPYHLRELAAAVLGDGGFSPCPVRIERG